MGAVTGKGLSDLIREEFGLRVTFVIMILLVFLNLTNIMAEFAGVATSLDLFGVSKFISVPVAAVLVWFVAVKGNYQSVEKIFLFACVIYVAYVIAGFLVKPDWKEAMIYSVRPKLMLDSGYIAMLIAMVGTTIAPWMQFYLQAAVVEKGITAKEYRESRIEVIVGCFMTSVIAFFIIVACAGRVPRSSHRYSERERSGAGVEAFRRIHVPAVQRRLAERFRLRGLHSAAFDGLFGLRGAGFRIGREPTAGVKRRSFTGSIRC